MPMDQMELEPSAHVVLPAADCRPLIPEPLPVRLLTVDDATLHAAAGLEVPLDEFYVGLLKFERDDEPGLAYRADNFRLCFVITDRKLDYTRQRGVTPGEERLVLQDPAGNWVEVVEYRVI